jgi:hypothetical protein
MRNGDISQLIEWRVILPGGMYLISQTRYLGWTRFYMHRKILGDAKYPLGITFFAYFLLLLRSGLW